MAGTVTYSHYDSQGVSAFASGKVVCDGAETNVLCGFQPNKIELFYSDFGATANAYYVWVNGIAAGTMAQFADAGDLTFETGGPTVYAGDGENNLSEGFTIPADLMTNTDVIYWVAWR